MCERHKMPTTTTSEKAATTSAAEPTEVTVDVKPAGKDEAKPAANVDAKPAAKAELPAEPEFRFFHLLARIHAMVVALPGYGCFLFKYLLLQGVRLVTQLSFVIAIYVMRDDLNMDELMDFKVTTVQYIVFGSLLALNIFGRLAPFATTVIIARFKEQLQGKQATAAFAKLFELPHGAVLSTPTGEFIQLISKIFRNLDPLLPGLYGNVIPVYVETVVAVLFIGICYGPIALLQLGLVAVYSVVAYRGARVKAQRNRELMQSMLKEFGGILAGAQSYERAHFFGNVDHEIDKTRKSFEAMSAAQLRVVVGDSIEGMKLLVVTLVVMALVVPLVFFGVDASIFEVAVIISYFAMFSVNLADFAIGISNLRTAVFEYQAFDAFLSRLSEVQDIEGAIELPADNPTPTIEFRDVSFSYGGRVILDNVSFTIQGGQTLGLVGSSGCGKSTVMRLLLRFWRPSSGTITIDGYDIRTVSGNSLRRLFSVVTQDAQLFNSSIRDNIRYGQMDASDDALLHAAQLAELDLANGDLSLDKECGEKGAKLSGGQQQRVSLARAMLKSGTVFLLDEPTTGLDGVVAKSIQKTLDELSARVTTICITHHLEDLKQADQILYLDNGKIVERGDFDSLMATEGEFYRQVQARRGATAAAS